MAESSHRGAENKRVPSDLIRLSHRYVCGDHDTFGEVGIFLTKKQKN